MAEPRFCPKEKKKKILGHNRMFLLDFLFQDLGILSRISLKKNWTQNASELIISFLFYLVLVCNLLQAGKKTRFWRALENT